MIAALPRLDSRVWILMVGRMLSQLGTGFVLFYAPIFFVNQVGLSAAAVGIGLGSESISGVIGRVMGGLWSDSPRWGRRKTLLLSAAISALAELVFTLSYDFPTFLAGNLLMGLGVGLYWPSTEAVVADLTDLEQRNEAYALTRLSDNVGLGLGVILGGWLIATTHAYRALFVVDGISFVVFFGVVYVAVAETLQPQQVHKPARQGWIAALHDRPLWVFVAVNVLFTTYLALVNSALPLYLTNFVPGREPGKGFDSSLLSLLIALYVLLTIVCQLPVARWLRRFNQPHALMASAMLWGIGFLLIWWAGTAASGSMVWSGTGLSVMALATVTYTPFASSLVVLLAPEAMRGVYLSINSLCWAVGYFIGPTVGGWAMGQSSTIAHRFWLVAALSIGIAIAILNALNRMLQQRLQATHVSNPFEEPE